MQQRVATKFFSHLKYTSPDPIDNDIAVIRVNQPFKFLPHIQPICLHNGEQKISTSGCFASGWGSETFELSASSPSQYLKKVTMDFADQDICQKQLRIALKKESFELTDSFFCAGGFENDLCFGDSGAPLICPIAGETNKFVLTGMSSWGAKCFTETPGVYTNVMKYFGWVQETISS
jgi:secreted trypsin-like serine protease